MPPSFFAIAAGIGPCLLFINPRYESEACGTNSIIISALMEGHSLTPGVRSPAGTGDNRSPAGTMQCAPE